MKITWKPVPNFAKGREGRKIEGVVVHIAEGNFQQTYSEFLNTQKSSHYFVKENGEIVQFVKEENTAWHAGILKKPTSTFVRARSGINPNLFTVGIEHAGTNSITEAQYLASGELIRDICIKNGILINREYIIGHREIRSDKTCPAGIDINKLIKYALEGETLEKKISWFQRQIDSLNEIISKLKK